MTQQTIIFTSVTPLPGGTAVKVLFEIVSQSVRRKRGEMAVDAVGSARSFGFVVNCYW